MTIQWYIKRLLSMEPKEVFWRTKSAARIPIEWLEHQAVQGRLVPKKHSDEKALNGSRYLIRAHNLGPPIHTLKIFDMCIDPNTQFDWHKDYVNNKVVPQKFSRLLNIRDPNVVGDIKYIWEINRHQHLSALAYAAKGEEYREHIITSIDSWISANPYLTGVNWTSSLELALRIISWAFVFPAISNQSNKPIQWLEKFSESVYLHLREIDRNLSLYSSANNHLVGEAAGLYVGSICFNWWTKGRAWRSKAKEILEREILLQVHEDGINKEQAMSYHLFTLELFLLALIVGTNAGDKFSENYLRRINSMLLYLSSVATMTGDLPWFGDSDDARGFLTSAYESNLQTTMELGGLFLGEPAYLRFSETPTTATRALLGDEKIMSHGNLKSFPVDIKSRSMFEKGGVAILQSDDRSVKLVMDFGEIGYTNIAAHGHADALSVLLALDDQYFLIDPGTYAYHSHESWRTYFRSTAAHNTIRIDKKDQSIMGGRFLWTAKAKVNLLKYEMGEAKDTIEAEHYGYQRLTDPVTHRRRVVFDKKHCEILIADTIDCLGKHDVELFFHLHQDASIEASGDNFVQVGFHNRRVVFTVLNSHFIFRVLRGSENPIVGWRSTSFGNKQPINTLRISGSTQGQTSIVTKIVGSFKQ